MATCKGLADTELITFTSKALGIFVRESIGGGNLRLNDTPR